MYQLNKPPSIFWVLTVLALVWNVLGVMAYLTQVFTPELVKASMTTEQVLLLESTPTVINAAFAVAVWAGFLGVILLLFRKALALFIFWLSLVGIIIQMGYNTFFTEALDVYGAQAIIMPIITLGIGVLMIVFAQKAAYKQWIA
tara:strand:- start:519 stop:950 length:432 start_codon:yes stop_codon:yes gene_type:complete